MDDRQTKRDKLVHDLLSKKPKWDKKEKPSGRPAAADEPLPPEPEKKSEPKPKAKPKPEPIEKKD